MQIKYCRKKTSTKKNTYKNTKVAIALAMFLRGQCVFMSLSALLCETSSYSVSVTVDKKYSRSDTGRRRRHVREGL